jgi:hypothetical protein
MTEGGMTERAHCNPERRRVGQPVERREFNDEPKPLSIGSQRRELLGQFHDRRSNRVAVDPREPARRVPHPNRELVAASKRSPDRDAHRGDHRRTNERSGGVQRLKATHRYRDHQRQTQDHVQHHGRADRLGAERETQLVDRNTRLAQQAVVHRHRRGAAARYDMADAQRGKHCAQGHRHAGTMPLCDQELCQPGVGQQRARLQHDCGCNEQRIDRVEHRQRLAGPAELRKHEDMHHERECQ